MSISKKCKNKFLRTQVKRLLGASALLLLGCVPSPEDSKDASTQKHEVENFAKNTPLGQASVIDTVSSPNILQVAMQSKEHSTLVAAVQAASIEHVLVNAGPLTVFAPVNAAFEALPPGTVESLLEPSNKSKLARILTHHAAPGSYDIPKLKKEAQKGRKLYTATGDYLEVSIIGEDVYVVGTKVLASVPTSNGIINVVDQVILPGE